MRPAHLRRLVADQLRTAHNAVDGQGEIVRGAGLEISGIPRRRPGDEHALTRSDHRFAVSSILGLDERLQAREPCTGDVGRNLTRKRRRRGSRPRTVDEAERAIEAELVDQRQRRVEIRRRFAGKADDEIGGERHIRTRTPHAADNGSIFERRIAALHRGKHAIGPGLHRKMQMRHQLVDTLERVDQPRRHFLRMRRRKANALDPGHFGDVFDQRRKIRRFAVHRAAIRIHVLAQQRDFADALVGQIRDLRQHVVERSGNFFAACVRDDAKRTILAAPFHD